MGKKVLQFSRHFSVSGAFLASLSEPLKAPHTSHEGGLKLWKKLSLFGAVPAAVLALINIKLSEEPKPTPFVKYSHLRIRNKPYPWRDGVKSLFHNPHLNALPDGYEYEIH